MIWTDDRRLPRGITLVNAAMRLATSLLVDAVKRAASSCNECFDRFGKEVRAEVVGRLKVGSPPRLRELVGIPDLEVPLNRVLAWLLMPDGNHGAGATVLREVASLVGFGALAEELSETIPKVEVYSQSSPLLLDEPRLRECDVRAEVIRVFRSWTDSVAPANPTTNGR